MAHANSMPGNIASLADLESAALALELPARARLTERLLKSLDDEDDEIMAAWAVEVDRRADAFDRGESTLIPFEDGMNRLQAQIAAYSSTTGGSTD
jgi:putative addiction module component (TIGR02574 family)